MMRREFIKVASGLALSWPAVGYAQRRARVPSIGVLWHAGSAAEEGIYFETLRLCLRDHGYIIGENSLIEDRFPNEEREKFFSLAMELAGLNVDVLVGAGRLASIALQRASMGKTPVVFINDPNPVENK